MKSILKIMAVMMLSISFLSTAQIKNAKTATAKIYGNCDMCKSTIEKAGNLKNIAAVSWNKETRMATLTYNSSKTNQQEILKRIALSGYDSDSFYAPDAVYAKFPACCQYERNHSSQEEIKHSHKEHRSANDNAEKQSGPPLKMVETIYFSIKDALVKSDAKTASEKSKELFSSIKTVKMSDLSEKEHNVWMKVMNSLSTDAKAISQTQDIAKQREIFKTLSTNMYSLIKVSKHSDPVYYQYCPMQDANWLSKESTVKNPYYGAKMLTCGKTVETLK